MASRGWIRGIARKYTPRKYPKSVENVDQNETKQQFRSRVPLLYVIRTTIELVCDSLLWFGAPC
jgi:hypothetical protein